MTDHRVDGRIARQLRDLTDDYDVTSASTGEASIEGVANIRLVKPAFEKSLQDRIANARMLCLRQYEKYYWSRPWVRAAVEQLSDSDADLLLINDLPLLPVAVKVAKGRNIIFDAHEYYPRQHEDRLFFRLLLRPYLHSLCKRYLPAARSVFTVSGGLADEYEKEFGIRPELLRNAPAAEDLNPLPVGYPIRLVYHGTAQPRRKLENIIASTIAADDKIELHLYLKTSVSRLSTLKQHAKSCPRVVFHPTVANTRLCQEINQYDMGIAFFPPTTFNLKHCLPNKFFEYIQARLGLIIGPSPDMKAIVEKHGCGIITETFGVDELTRTLNNLTPDVAERFKARSNEVAPLYTWENEVKGLRAAVANCLTREF
jgi:hypothetical protein